MLLSHIIDEHIDEEALLKGATNPHQYVVWMRVSVLGPWHKNCGGS